MTSPTVTAFCAIVMVLVGCFVVESVTTGGQLWLYSAGFDGKHLTAARAETLGNVSRVSECALHCTRLDEKCAFFFYDELKSKCSLCKPARCNKDTLTNGGKYRFFSRMTWSTCPMSRSYRYYSDVNLCVRYGSSAQWFQSASRSCAMDGGHLVYINSQAEYERLKDFINEWTAHLRDDNGKDVTRPAYQNLWLGGQRSATTGKWVWGDGSSAEAFLGSKWASGQPTAKDYLAISLADSFKMRADDNPNVRRFVCEIDVLQ